MCDIPEPSPTKRADQLVGPLHLEHSSSRNPSLPAVKASQKITPVLKTGLLGEERYETVKVSGS
jgi:hypothetical protein